MNELRIFILKNYFNLLITSLLTLFLYCPLNAITQGDLVEREGLFYEKFTDVPFSGEVSGKYERYRNFYLENGAYEKGLKTGIWVSYHENGQLRYKGEFKKGQKIGHWLEYDWLGTKLLDGNYTNGSFKSFTPRGELITEGNYLNGKKEGYWIERDVVVKDRKIDGVKNLEMGIYKLGLREGRWELHFENGCSIPSQKKPLRFKDIGKDAISFNDYLVHYFSKTTTKGDCYLVGNYIKDKKEGEWIYYYQFSKENLNNRVLGKGLYENGYKNGPWEYYHFNQNLHSRGTYHLSNMNGSWEFFYENGNLEAKGTLKNENKWDGVWDFFKIDGTFDRVEIWKNGNFIISESIVPD